MQQNEEGSFIPLRKSSGSASTISKRKKEPKKRSLSNPAKSYKALSRTNSTEATPIVRKEKSPRSTNQTQGTSPRSHTRVFSGTSSYARAMMSLSLKMRMETPMILVHVLQL